MNPARNIEPSVPFRYPEEPEDCREAPPPLDAQRLRTFLLWAVMFCTDPPRRKTQRLRVSALFHVIDASETSIDALAKAHGVSREHMSRLLSEVRNITRIPKPKPLVLQRKVSGPMAPRRRRTSHSCKGV